MWSKTELLSKSSSIFFIGTYYPSNLLKIWTDFTKEPCNLVLGTCITCQSFLENTVQLNSSSMKTGMVTSENDFFNKKEMAELSQIQLSKQVTPMIIFQWFLSMSFYSCCRLVLSWSVRSKAAVFTRGDRTDELDKLLLFNTGLQYCCLTLSFHKVDKANLAHCRYKG